MSNTIPSPTQKPNNIPYTAGKTKNMIIRYTIESILSILPEEKSTDIVRQELGKLSVNLGYTAPEIIDTIWSGIYNILCKYIPLDNDDEKNPTWKINIRDSWTKNCTGYMELDRLDNV